MRSSPPARWSGSSAARAKATAQALLDAGWVNAVASDAHNLGGRRPYMRLAASWLASHYGEAAAEELTVTGPAALCRQPSRGDRPAADCDADTMACS